MPQLPAITTKTIVKAANDTSKLVCFPFANYRNRFGSNKPAKPGLVYGPRLEDAVKQMGALAKGFLDSTTPINTQDFNSTYYPDPN